MFGYYLEIAIHSLRRNVVLTTLMVAAVGVGIGASMTMLTTLVAMSSNPIPDRSSQLFVPQIDVTGYASRHHNVNALPQQLTYRDAVALMKAQKGARQAAMYPVQLNVQPQVGDPFQVAGRATYTDFFAMFEVPFRSGSDWGQKGDDGAENLVVLSAKLADRLFPKVDPVGQTINLGQRNYRITGVIGPWTPVPRFYDVLGADSFVANAYSDTEDFYLPFATAINGHMDTNGYESCVAAELPSNWTARLNSNCPWIQFWVQLPNAGQLLKFKTFLENYAAEQRHLGRFDWLPLVALRDVMEWLNYMRIVPTEARVDSLIAIGFLIVCLLNAVGLMLAKFSGRAVELSVRRALGASRADISLHCISETILIGLLGGMLGLVLTAAGLSGLRGLQDVANHGSAAGRLVSLNTEMVLITFAVAVISTICSGLYPALRASRVQPSWQLKSQ